MGADPDEVPTFYLRLLDGRLLQGTADSAGVEVLRIVLIMRRAVH